MDTQMVHEDIETVWSLAARQHGVVSRRQLLDLGLHCEAIKHRLRRGRLHRVRRGVYAVGRPNLTPYGRWMAAVLACGANSFLSHRTAAALWKIDRPRDGAIAARPIDMTVAAGRRPRCDGIRVHRVRHLAEEDRAECDGIPVTAPIRTMIDLALVLSATDLERAINESDRLGLADPETLRSTAEARAGQHGVAPLRAVLDRRTFTITDSELERRFLRLAQRARLPRPLTQQQVNGFRVDFYWPEFGLVVETDGLRYHRTASQQAKDRVRDQRHAALGFIALRFSHAQVVFEPENVISTLRAVMRRQRPKLWTA